MASLAPATVPSRFVGMHYSSYTTGTGAPTPAPSYSPKIWRGYDTGINWRDIETSDNVFVWTTIQERVAYAVAQGQDVFYQIFGTPSFARLGTPAWSGVKDQMGVAGACCVPDPIKLERFVTNLLTQCPDIKYLSVYNEPKWDGPVVKFQGSYINGTLPHGCIAKGDTVKGITTGVTGVVIDASQAGWLVVRLPVGALDSAPFGNSEVISVDGTVGGSSGTKFFTATNQFAVSYWFGTKQQLVTTQQTVYTAAHAAKPGIIVTTPDFTEGANIAGEEEWLETWIDAGGKGYFDAVAYHFYCYDIRPTTSSAHAYSIVERCNTIDRILSDRGINVPKIASECGFLPGWDFYSTDKGGQAHTLKRITAYLAARGWIGVIWFNHSQEYCGNPSTNPVIADALKWLGIAFGGKTISGAYVDTDNSLRMLVNGNPMIL